MADWEHLPGVNAVTGLDNFRLFAQRPPDFYDRVKPMLNIGGMMEYPRGKGGIVLCNLLFQQNESVPANYGKKRTILATLLRNLNAPFGNAAKTIIAGAKLKYSPIDLSKQANQFRNEQGWYGDKTYTFRDIPLGKENFAGVDYDIYEFPTSPVPTGIPGNLPDQVNGIPVNCRADALFFLQAARIDRRRNAAEIKRGDKFELARYVVHYADGQTVEVPVYSEINVDDYKQQTPPLAIPGAQIAWSEPYSGTNRSAVAYSMQWTNPRPEVEIKSIDLAYGKQKCGVPALISLTAATAQ
jgi:beta-galactosidase